MQLIYLTFVLRSKSDFGLVERGNIIRILTNKMLPIAELKTLQQQIKGTSLDCLKYMEFWRENLNT